MSSKSINRSKKLPVQELLEGEYLRVRRFHKDLNKLSVVPHRHDHYEMIIVTEGTGKHSINFKSFDIIPGRVYFIHPGQVHLIEDFERDGWLILFGEELFKRFLDIHLHEDEYGLLDTYTAHPFIDLTDNLKPIFSSLIEQLKAELSTEKQDVDILLHYVSLLLLHANRSQIVQHPKEQLSVRNKLLFHELKGIIEAHFKHQHQASFFAESLNVDIKQLNKICRKVTGLTVFELLQERLLTESKIQLQTSAGSVKEISYELGFNDPAFFGRFFKSRTGVTPAQFRQSRTI